MKNEQVIMEQLDHLGQEIATLTDSARALRELRDDLSPRVNETVKVLIEQLAEMEADVQFEDLTALLKNLMRNVRNLGWSVDQLKNLIDFLRTVEPLLKSAVPQAIIYLDKLERQGVFRVVASMMGVLEKIAETYTPEDIEQIENGLVPLVGVAKKLTTPEALNLLDKAAEVPARVDLSQAKAVGPFGMLFALGNSEVKQGMGVVLELTKALSLLKNGEGTEESEA
ncbi:MAG: DUF1641 domain-containing protein [Deltaproteobacteria bacterium]|nr:DUF1641 domain-containing protein [Deltaproteobacteria bacterium]